MENNTKLLESILATQVLILERMIVMEKKGRGVTSGECIQEAITLVARKKEQIVSSLLQHPAR